MKNLTSVLLIFMLLIHSVALAEGPKPCAFSVVDHGPQEPESITKPKKITPLGCERPFGYRGQIYSADTPQAQDASTLKSIIESVPESKELMVQYQSNRTKSKISAYTGTAGFLIFAFSNLIALNFDPKSRTSVKNALRIGGLSIAAGGFLFSFALLRTNEYLLPRAVNKYNEANPNDPVDLQFSASWGF